MNEVRRARILCDIDLLIALRGRLEKIRDDEERSRADSRYDADSTEKAMDFLSEANQCCMVVIDRLVRARKC